jgi:phosphopantothenoylcysteine decarboxylase/phosphopantothenate--cysteine ligase
MSKNKILFQLSGSIACYKACQVISRLVQAGYEVQTVATPAALEFVGPATLESLSGKPVQSRTFAPGAYMQHIHLLKWADLILLCPATANLLNKLAAGIGDDLISTLFLAHDFQKPYLIAPAMNMWMHRHPATQASLAKLKDWGVEFLDAGRGSLACGDVGEGRLMEPELILAEIQRRLPLTLPVPKAHSGLRVLVTSGGTKEAIDGVRSITNTSTGATGALIAGFLADKGHAVTLVHAEAALLPNISEPASKIKRFAFHGYNDLDETLRRLLAETRFDAVIHMAAVSDFSVDHLVVNDQAVSASVDGKIASDATVSIQLKRNPKILPKLKDYARDPNLTVVGFKLTNNASEAERITAVAKVASGADLIVHNDATEIRNSEHHATLYAKGGVLNRCASKSELAARLEEFLLQAAATRKKETTK